jgi:hypothetical protein
MSTPDRKPVTEDATSYYDQQAKWVSKHLKKFEPTDLKPLLTCYLTIKEFHKLLYDPKINLADDIVDTFIKDIMLVDFGQVILDLLKYRGKEREIAESTHDIIDAAQGDLYKAYNSLVKNGEYQKRNAKVAALKACRLQLHQAYLLLEYLDKKIEPYYNPQ